MRPDGTQDDLPWTAPEGFRLETVVPDGKGGLFLVGPISTLHLAKGATKPKPFAKAGSSAGAARRAKDGSLLLGSAGRVVRVRSDGEVVVLAKDLGEVFDVIEDARGRIVATDWQGGRVLRIDGEEHEVLAKGLSYPSGLALDAKGNLYVKESGRMTNTDMRILRIDAEGRRSLFASVPSVTRWRTPEKADDR